jgi:hypothetical protein
VLNLLDLFSIRIHPLDPGDHIVLLRIEKSASYIFGSHTIIVWKFVYIRYPVLLHEDQLEGVKLSLDCTICYADHQFAPPPPYIFTGLIY